MPQTSTLGPALEFTGTTFEISTTDSPISFAVVANVSEISIPAMSEKVDVTNAGDEWRRRIPTLLDMGSVTVKIFWVPTEATHENVSAGLRYLMLNKTHRYFKFGYSDGLDSADIVPGYVTGFQVTGKVGGVWEASVELSNSGEPTLV